MPCLNYIRSKICSVLDIYQTKTFIKQSLYFYFEKLFRNRNNNCFNVLINKHKK